MLFSLEMFYAGAAAVQQVAEELKDIADQLEHGLLAEAAQNLRRNLLISTSDVSLNCSSEFCRTFTLNYTTVVLQRLF